MIALDTSALMAIVLAEADADRCIAAMADYDTLLLSATNLAEALVVARRRNVGDEMARLVEGLGVDVVGVDTATARRAAAAYDRWGKGSHPAALNFGDCFAYALAEAYDCPLLFTGSDFSQTDVRRAA